MEVYPSGLGESVLQILGPISRVATVSEINSWNITMLDTLASLMNPINGAWTTNQSNALIMKYLSVSGNRLGVAEINTIRSYLCSLSIDVLSTITVDSLKYADAVDLSSCSYLQKTVVYNIADISYVNQSSSIPEYYQLISPYLGGAPLSDIMALSAQNISMDITTFSNLNPDVVMALDVNTVQNLFKRNLPVLKLFENNTLVQSWRLQQYQYQLDTLSIGLIGKANPTTASITPSVNITNTTTTTYSSTTTSVISTSRTTSTTPLILTTTNYSTTANVTAGCATVHRDAGLWHLSLLVGLLMATLHTIH